MWSTDFRDGITKMELRELEAVLREKACSSTEVIQQDFCILTPTYRTVRAKVCQLSLTISSWHFFFRLFGGYAFTIGILLP